MKKLFFVILCTICTLCVCLALSACGEDEHEHVWNDGEITTAATCTEGGAKTYTCTTCKETYTELIAAIGHSWDDGKVTTAATCTEDGVKTYTCTTCKETYTEPILAIEHDYKLTNSTAASLSAAGAEIYTCTNCGDSYTDSSHFTADYTDDFGTVSIWKYGYTTNYNYETNEFTFIEGTFLNDAYIKVNEDGGIDGIELKSDWINTNGGNAVIAYSFTVSGDVVANLGFIGDNEEETRVIVRMVLVSDNGLVRQFGFYGDGQSSKDWTVSGQFSANGGDTLYFVFNNEGAGYATGKFTCELTAHYSSGWQVSENGEEHLKTCVICGETYCAGVHNWIKMADGGNGIVTYTCTACGKTKKTVITELADFAADFTAETQNGSWSYGYVNYNWGEKETFTFIQSENYAGDAWIADGVEVKAGWINAGSMTTAAYTANENVTVTISVNFKGSTDNTRLALRIGIKDDNGNLYSNPAFINNNGDNTITYNVTLTLHAGDVIYFIFSNENGGDSGAYPNGELNITLFTESEYVN